MNKIIQLRGSHATGKSTAVRQFLAMGNFTEERIIVGGKEYSYYFEPAKRYAVLGKYPTASTGGLDGYITDVDILKEYICKVLKTAKPRALIFEGVMYGKTFKFAKEIDALARRLGYEYIGVTFVPPLETTFGRLAERNGGKDINIQHTQNTYFSVITAAKKLAAAGVKIRIVDTSKIERGDMWKIISRETSR